MKFFFRKLISFFDEKDRKKMYGILFCVIVMGFIEMVSIAAIFPFLAVISRPEVIETNLYLHYVYQGLGFSTPKYFMFFLGCGVFSLLVIGNLFSAFTTWLMMRFSYAQGYKISTNLLEKYLSQPYPFFLHNNSNYLQKNILAEVDRLVTGIVINLGLTVSKAIVGASILILLLIIDAKLTAIIFLSMGGAYCMFYALTAKKLRAAGIQSSAVNSERYTTISEVLGAIKELKTLNRENTFIAHYYSSAKRYARFESTSQLTPLVIRYLIEILAFGGMLLIALYLIWTKDSLNRFLPLLGLYALSGYRLMPAAQQIFSGITLGKYHSGAVDILYDDYKLLGRKIDNNQKKVIKLNHALMLEAINYSYPQANHTCIQNLSLSIRSCTTIGFVGYSGAGKTTLVDIILGLLTPDQGSINVDGEYLDDNNMSAWQKNIGYVPQNIYLTDSSISSNIAFGIDSEHIDINKVKRAAELAHLDKFILEELSNGYDTLIGEAGVRLSGGQRQRIGIARALYHEPQLLIFDEATSALDNQTEKVIIDAIHNFSKKKTIILIAHRLQTVKDCDVIYVLEKGKIVGQGTYDELIDNNNMFKSLAREVGCTHAGTAIS